MAVRVNLLPDLRQAKLRARHHRQLAAGLATLVCAASIGVVVMLFAYVQVQGLRIHQLQGSINEKQATFLATPELEKMLTTQAHLAALPQLYDQRVLMTRFFNILGTISPRDLALQSLSIDETNTLKITGQARSYALATKLAKALEASNVTIGQDAKPDNQPHFLNVALADVTSDTTNGKVNFSLSAGLSPEATHGTK